MLETDGELRTERGERCLLCRRPLGSRTCCVNGMCVACDEEVAAYLNHFQISSKHRQLAIDHLWQIAQVLGRFGQREHHHLAEFLMRVPTYYGSISENRMPTPAKEEFDEPWVPVLVREADGVRLVLGSHDFEDMLRPDIQVERRPNGWAIFLHPMGGSDAAGFVYFLDDGRSYLVKGSTFDGSSIQVREADTPLDDLYALIDRLPERNALSAE